MAIRGFDPTTGRWCKIDDDGWDKPELSGDKKLAKLLLDTFRWDLSERDKDFLFSAKTQTTPLSPKQIKWLRDIEARLRRLFRSV